MKNNKLFVTVASITSFAFMNSANAVDLSKRVYFNSNIHIGYTEQKYKGDAEHFIDNAKANPWGATYKTKGSGIVVGTGGSFYFRLNSIIHPFIGTDIRVRFPYGNTEVYSAYTYGFDIKEYGMFNVKLGTKINLYKKYIAIAPYGLAGLNVECLQVNDWNNFKKYDYNIGHNFGFGVDLIINEMFIVGLEYRYGTNKFTKYDVMDVSQKHFTETKIKTNNFMVKFGVQFM